MKLKCQCCGFESEFADSEAAFDAGWDARPHFTTHVCCPLCPAVCVVMGKGHKQAHALWAKEGRPGDFTIETCATDDQFGNPEALKKTKEQVALIDEFIARARKMTGLDQ